MLALCKVCLKQILLQMYPQMIAQMKLNFVVKYIRYNFTLQPVYRSEYNPTNGISRKKLLGSILQCTTWAARTIIIRAIKQNTFLARPSVFAAQSDFYYCPLSPEKPICNFRL